VTVTGAASDGSKIVIVGYNSSGIPVYSHS